MAVKASAGPLVGLRRPLSATFRLFFWVARALQLAPLVLAVLCVSFGVRAAPRRISIQVTGQCPTARQLAEELRGMLPSVEVTEPETPGSEPIVVVEDERGLSVEVVGSRRYFEDVQGRCGERASQASVFVALMLDPLRLPPAAPRREPPAPTPRRAPQLPPPARVAHSRTILSLGPSLQVAPATDLEAAPLALGVAARLRRGRALLFTAGVGFLSTTTLHFARADARERLLALDAGIGWGVWRGNGGFVAELSPVVAPALVQGEHLERTRSRWGLEWGVRAALTGEWWLSRQLGLFASESGLWWPRPISLSVGGIGDVGHTPAFWLGSQLGLVVRVD